MFENKKDEVFKIHYSRWIMSWLRSGGKLYDSMSQPILDWLREVGLKEDDVINIRFMISNGKLECEDSAEKYLKEHDLV